MIKKGSVNWGLKKVILILIVLIIILATATIAKGGINRADTQTTNAIAKNAALSYCAKICITCFQSDCPCNLPENLQYENDKGNTIKTIKCSELGKEYIPTEHSSGTDGAPTEKEKQQNAKLTTDELEALNYELYEDANMYCNKASRDTEITNLENDIDDSETLTIHIEDETIGPTKTCLWSHYNDPADTSAEGVSIICTEDGDAYYKECKEYCYYKNTYTDDCIQGCDSNRPGYCMDDVIDTSDDEPDTPTYDEPAYVMSDDGILSIPQSDSPLTYEFKQNKYSMIYTDPWPNYNLEIGENECHLETSWEEGIVLIDNCNDFIIHQKTKEEEACYFDNSAGCSASIKCEYEYKETRPISQQCKNWECTNTGWQPTETSNAEAWCDNLDEYIVSTSKVCNGFYFTDNTGEYREIENEELICNTPSYTSISWFCKDNVIYRKTCDSGCADGDTGFCAK